MIPGINSLVFFCLYLFVPFVSNRDLLPKMANTAPKHLIHYDQNYCAENCTEEKEGSVMALTRSFLKGMGLTDEQVSAIIEAHVDTTDALKTQRDAYKADADKLAEVQAQLTELQSKGDGGWQKKYEDEHNAFETFKTETSAKESAAATRTAYSKLLKDAGVAEKYIDSVLKVSDLASVKVGEDGTIEGADGLLESIKTDYADFIPKSGTQGASVPTPPAGGKTYTLADVRSMSAAEINANWDAVQQALKTSE